jgi:hypothetical protein
MKQACKPPTNNESGLLRADFTKGENNNRCTSSLSISLGTVPVRFDVRHVCLISKTEFRVPSLLLSLALKFIIVAVILLLLQNLFWKVFFGL